MTDKGEVIHMNGKIIISLIKAGIWIFIYLIAHILIKDVS